MLQLQDEERRTRDSSRKRETPQHISDQAHDKRHLSTEGEPDAYGNPRSRCSEANSTDEELTEPGSTSC